MMGFHHTVSLAKQLGGVFNVVQMDDPNNMSSFLTLPFHNEGVGMENMK